MTTKERTFGRFPVDLYLALFLMIYTCRMGYDHKDRLYDDLYFPETENLVFFRDIFLKPHMAMVEA